MVYSNGYYVAPALPGDAALLAPHLRKADVAEIRGLTDKPLEALLGESLRLSQGRCFAILRLGDPTVYALFGCAPGAPGEGIPWFLSREEVVSDRHLRRLFLRHSREWLKVLSKGYSLLGNWVSSGNTVHVRWLRWLGFTPIKEHRIGDSGKTYLEFLFIP